MNGLFLFFFILVVSAIVSLAQEQDNSWAKIYESSTDNVRTYDKATSIIKASDGNYLIAGFTKLHLGKKIISNLAILKIDTYGNIIWSTKTIEKGNPGFKAEIIALKDGGYAVVYAQFLLRLDENGNILWINKFGKNKTEQSLEFTSIQELDDSGFITSGRTYSPDKYNTMVMKLDKFGKIIWSKSYFGYISEYARIRKLDDGGFILGNSGSSPDFGHVTQLTKLDADGKVEWEKLYEPLDGSHHANRGFSTFCLTKNKEIITTIPDGGRYRGCLILKLSPDGDFIWSKLITIPGAYPITIKDIRCLENGDLILVGEANQNINPGGGGEVHNLNTFALKMDQNGNIFWLKTLGKSPKMNDRDHNQDEYALSVETSDTGEILYVGTCSSFSSIPDAYNFIAVKMNLDGEVSNGGEYYLREVDLNDKRRIEITSPNELDVKEFRNESKEINDFNEYDMVDFDFTQGNFTEKNLPKPELKLALSDRGRTLTTNLTIFVKEDEVGNLEIDSDKDGIVQEWEDMAMDYINPYIELDEEEPWLTVKDTHRVANYVRVHPYPDFYDVTDFNYHSTNLPQYIIFRYVVTWSMDYGRQTVGGYMLDSFTSHEGDHERIFMAWKVIDSNTLRLEWVFTSSHEDPDVHHGVWNAWHSVCNKGDVAYAPPPEFYHTEVFCGNLKFSQDNRLIFYASEGKHALYPSCDICENVMLVDLLGPGNIGEDCGGGGRFRFGCYNVGEPSDFIDPKVADLTLKEGKLKDPLPNIFDYKLRCRYRIQIKTGNKKLAGTDAKLSIKLFGSQGTSQWFEVYTEPEPPRHHSADRIGTFEKGDTDNIYINSPDLGEINKIQIKHDNSGLGPGWYIGEIWVEDLETNTTWHSQPNTWLDKVLWDDNTNKTFNLE